METEQKVNKTKDRKAYMREYMKRRYELEKEQGIIERTKYYYIYKGEANEEDKKKYKNVLPTIVKLRKLIEKLKNDETAFQLFLQEIQNI